GLCKLRAQEDRSPAPAEARPHDPRRRLRPPRAGRVKPKSLRARLALWQAGLLALTLLSLSGLTYLLLRQMLQSRADAGLADYADTIAKNIAGSLYQAGTLAPAPLRRP